MILYMVATVRIKIKYREVRGLHGLQEAVALAILAQGRDGPVSADNPVERPALGAGDVKTRSLRSVHPG